LKLRRCFHVKIIIEEGFGIIARIAMNISLFHLVAIPDYALAVARDIQTNGHQCYLRN